MKMKMVNSLLLGSAAGIVGVAGAQAADLPVKAKPVEYVKVCSLYGAGYYYIPGTDICSKIGGYVRYEATYNFGSHMTTGPWVFNTTSYDSGANSRTRGTSDYTSRVRAYITQETRQQTQYGTLRTYLNVGVSADSPATSGVLATSAGGFSANRAFIQIAGFTFGLATSYYDFYSAPATSFFAPPSSDAGDGGQRVWAYTAQLGNGLSASVSLEDPRRLSNFNVAPATASTAGLIPSPSGTDAYKKVVQPDYVANLRIDQAWGSAQVMGVLHDASPGYFGTSANLGGIGNTHPADKWGWALGAGIKINTPFVSPGDYLQAQYNYSVGAGRYVATSLGSASAFARNGGTLGYGFNSDGVYSSTSNVAGSSLELTTSWGVNAAYEHFWTPALRTSLYGSYMKVQYSALANGFLCSVTHPGTGAAGTLNGNCNNDYAWWTLGSRSQWNITKDFYIGVDVIYMKLDSASSGATVSSAGTSTMPIGTYLVQDQSIWAGRIRAHRDIVP